VKNKNHMGSINSIYLELISPIQCARIWGMEKDHSVEPASTRVVKILQALYFDIFMPNT
jgi:hypothetical protein